ncbi:MAG TPA: ComEC/Rec2 family competence protein [Cellulomonas sp.]|uniref:ComEC/Rec2 family competence protein n=1 Tax=Cellulomonas sp. TaxID=40001 RepID=UPI002E373DB8|nr:ComEC/Rec2 family competence protein [Cellulomonas sp.]HEX5331409.1 ComEC/Rec2 family competence protein [Cellulomonas sp.]
MGEGLDLRLVPSACTAWVAAVAVVVMSPQLAAGLAAVAAVLGVATVDLARRRSRVAAVDGVQVPRPPTRERAGDAGDVRAVPDCGGAGSVGREGSGGRVVAVGTAGQVVLVLAVLTVVLGAGAAQLRARQAGGIGALAAERAVVRVTGTVESDAVPVASSWPGAPARFRVELSTHSVGAGGVESASAAPVVVLGGSGWSDAVYGSEVAASGRLSAAEPGSRAVAVLVTSGSPSVLADPGPWLGWAARVRSALAGVASTLPGDAGALLPGVAVGDTSALPTDLADAMRGAGLTHLTAVSGAHFALVGAAVLACAGAMRMHRRARVVVLVAALAGFVVLVHPGASVLRAAAMGALGVAGLVVGRPARAMPALSAGVVVLLVADPWLAREIGFVLSVLATAGLVLLAKPLAARWSSVVGTPIAYALAVPVAAQSVCAPVVILLSPAVSTYAVPANLLADLAVAPATVIGLLAALVAPWWPAGASVLASVAGAACWWIGAVARTAVSLPGAQVPWLAGPPGAALLALATAALLALVLHGRPSTSHADRASTPALEPASAPDPRFELDLIASGSSTRAGHSGRERTRQSVMALLVRATRDANPPDDRPTLDRRGRCRSRVGRGTARARRARVRPGGAPRRPGGRPSHRAGP